MSAKIRCRDCERPIPIGVVRSYVDGYPESMMRCTTCASWSETVGEQEREIARLRERVASAERERNAARSALSCDHLYDNDRCGGCVECLQMQSDHAANKLLKERDTARRERDEARSILQEMVADADTLCAEIEQPLNEIDERFTELTQERDALRAEVERDND